MKHYLFFLIGSLLIGSQVFSQSYGEIRGLIQNTDYEAIPYASIKVYQADVMISGAKTDENGKYSIKPLNPGTYELVIQHPEYPSQTIRKINVTPNNATYVDYKLTSNLLGEVVVEAEPVDYTSTGVDINVFHTISLSGKDLMQNSGTNRGEISTVLLAMTSEAVQSSNGEIHVRGARAGTTGYFVDGVRTLDANFLPGLGIENVSAFTGGVPAMYGDLTSGAVMITTKTYFSGLREKTMRIAAMEEANRLQAAKQKAIEEEEKRKKEIETEGN